MIKMESILKMRWIYVAGIVLFIMAFAVRCSKEDKQEIENKIPRELLSKGCDFWPPDIVPHPHPPQPTPSDGNA